MIFPFTPTTPYVPLESPPSMTTTGALNQHEPTVQHPGEHSSLRSLKDEETPWEEWKHSIMCISFYTGAGLLYCFCWAGWGLVDSTYFLIVTGSTVGYGDISFPLDTTSSLFACCYLVLGVGIAAYSAGLVLNKWVQTTETEMAKEVQQSHMKRSEQSLMRNRLLRKHLLTSLARLAVTLCVGAGVIGLLEGWGGPKALYWCVQTVTTVGYGNLQLTSTASKVFTIFFIPIGVAVGASTMSSLASIPLIKQRAKAERRVLHQFGNELDPRAFDQLSKAFKELKRLGLCQSPKFITRNEFLIWMLLQLQRVDEKDLKYCGATFDMMDANCDGRLDYRDIQEVRRKAVQQGRRISTRPPDTTEAGGSSSQQSNHATPTLNIPNSSSVSAHPADEEAPELLQAEPRCSHSSVFLGQPEVGYGELYSKSSNTTIGSSPRNGESFAVGRETTLDCVTRDLVPIMMKSHTVMLSRTCDKSARFVRSGTMADDESVASDDSQPVAEVTSLPRREASPPKKTVRLCIPDEEVSTSPPDFEKDPGSTPNRGRRRTIRGRTVHFTELPKGTEHQHGTPTAPDCNV